MKRSLTAAAVLAAAGMLGTAVVLAQQVSRVPPLALPQWESCEEMHDTYVGRFESARGFGLSRMPQPAMLDRSGTLDLGRTHYSIERIELVGLLTHETPVVYVPQLHSAMPTAADFKSRELTDFEKGAIAAFRAGRDIAVANEPGTLRCVGALRAKDTCLNCHKSKKLGDLLGAFTYTMRERSGGN